MTKMFMPKVATPSVPAKAPDVATPAVEAAAEAERKRKRAGLASTMLTGSAGATGAPVGTTKLLGG